MTQTQRYEIEEWLGDDHGLTDDQIDDLTRSADDIGEQYPDPDDQAERDAALVAAYRIMVGEDIIEELAAARTAARDAESTALAGLRQAARMLIPDTETQAGFARRAGVDRMAVRDWLGLR